MITLALRGLSKRFGTVVAMDNLHVEVEQGTLTALIGPSGCGKTTTLRVIAGLETPDSGKVWLRGQDVSGLPPESRAVGLVFQSYALFPHLSVARNVAYGLRSWPRRARTQRTAELLELVGLPDHAGRRPNQLSQGQKQRVALARALAPKPDVLLMDEPLAALDAALRLSLRSELRNMLRQLGVTTLYVTHDQAEALALADRLAVMRSGHVEQEGLPHHVYLHPKSPFVASFLGRANLWPADVVNTEDGWATVEVAGKAFTVPAGTARDGDQAYLFFRPEDVVKGNELSLRVEHVEFQGDRWEVHTVWNGLPTLVYLSERTDPGALVTITIPKDRVHLLPKVLPH